MYHAAGNTLSVEALQAVGRIGSTAQDFLCRRSNLWGDDSPYFDRCAAGLGMVETEARLGLVQLFHDDAGLRDQLRAALRALPDIGRALGRVAVGRGSPRDLGQLRDGLGEARLLRERLARLPDMPPLLQQLLPALDGHGELVDALSRALVPAPPTETANGGYIADGYDPALDELRRMAGDGRRAIAALEAKYRDQTGIGALKIRHNGVLGYHVEVPARAADEEKHGARVWLEVRVDWVVGAMRPVDGDKAKDARAALEAHRLRQGVQE